MLTSEVEVMDDLANGISFVTFADRVADLDDLNYLCECLHFPPP